MNNSMEAHFHHWIKKGIVFFLTQLRDTHLQFGLFLSELSDIKTKLQEKKSEFPVYISQFWHCN